MGDPSKLIQLEPVLRTIKADNLIERAKESGDRLLSGLVELQVFVVVAPFNKIYLVQNLFMIGSLSCSFLTLTCSSKNFSRPHY